MTRNSVLTPKQEERLNEVLAAYLEAVEQGQKPDQRQLLSRYPDLARELSAFFANRSQLLPRGVAQAQSELTTDKASPAFGDYELLKEIARGGMGVVYQARQRSLNRTVALKMILADGLPTPSAVRRFRIEAEAVASLDHPNIVPIYEVGEREGHHYFSMKLIENGSLKDHLSKYLQQPRAAVQLLMVVARAIHHAHLRGVLHRDLKPGNILLDAQGEPHVTDFGLAKRVTADGQASQSHAIVGTANYMAPEQALAKNAPLTTSCDVYSLGAILFELLTGRPPFQGSSYFDTLIQVVQVLPPKLRSVKPRLDRDLEAICWKCLQKEPRDRYDTAADLANDLDCWLADRSTQARPLGKGERLWRWSRRNPLVAMLSVLVFGLIVALGAYSAVDAWHLQIAKNNLETVNQDLLREKANLATVNQELETANKKAEEQAANATRLAGEEHNARAAAERARKKAEEANKVATSALQTAKDQRQVAEAAHKDAVAQRLKVQEALVNEQKALALATQQREANRTLLVRQLVANGTHFLDQHDLSSALAWFGEALNLDKGDPKRELNHRIRLAAVIRRFPRLVQLWSCEEAVREPVFSPDGQLVLLTVTAGPVHLKNPSTGKDVVPPLAHADGVVVTRFSPNGKWLATVSSEGKVRVWDVATGKLKPELRQSAGTVQDVAFSPDSKRLLTGSKDGTARVWEAATGKAVGVANKEPWHWKHEGEIHHIGFTRDGKRAFTAGTDGKGKGLVRFWDAVKGQALHKIDKINALVRVAFLSNDEQRLFTVTGQIKSSRGQVWDAKTGKHLAGPFTSLRGSPDGWCSPDGKMILTGNTQAPQVSDLLTGKALTPTLWHAGDVVYACFSHDGKALLTGCTDKTARVWDTATGQPLTPPLRHATRVVSGSFSADGRRVLTVCYQKSVRVWELPRREPLHLVAQLPDALQHTEISPDGKLALALPSGGKLRVWEVKTGKTVSLVGVPETNLRQAIFSPDGSRLAVADKDTLRVWEIDASKLVGKPLSPVIKHTSNLQHLQFTPNGSGVAALGPTGVQVWHAVSGTLLGALHKTGKAAILEGVALSPDGKRLVNPKWGANQQIRQTLSIYDLQERKPTKVQLQLGAPVVATAFAADGHLVTAAGDGAVRIWNVVRGEPVAPALIHPQVFLLAISRDSQRLATAAKDGTVRVWDAETGQPLTLPLPPGEPLRRLMFNVNGDRLLMTSITGQVRSLELRPVPLETAKLVQLTQVLAGQRLHAASGGLVPMDSGKLQQVWKEMGGN